MKHNIWWVIIPESYNDSGEQSYMDTLPPFFMEAEWASDTVKKFAAVVIRDNLNATAEEPKVTVYGGTFRVEIPYRHFHASSRCTVEGRVYPVVESTEWRLA